MSTEDSPSFTSTRSATRTILQLMVVIPTSDGSASSVRLCSSTYNPLSLRSNYQMLYFCAQDDQERINFGLFPSNSTTNCGIAKPAEGEIPSQILMSTAAADRRRVRCVRFILDTPRHTAAKRNAYDCPVYTSRQQEGY